MKRFVTAAALVGVALFTVAPANAAANVVVAGPGAAVAGTYLTPVAVVVRTGGAPFTFVNADIAPHDVRSTKTRVVSGVAVPLFKSAIIEAGTAPVVFLTGVNAGDYEFFCKVHPNMRGTVTLAD